jgi:ubiquinone biosynthesis protein COQ9
VKRSRIISAYVCLPLFQIAAAKCNLQDTSALAESEVSAMRAKALKDAEEDCKAWAEVQKVSIRQKKLDEAMHQVV